MTEKGYRILTTVFAASVLAVFGVDCSAELNGQQKSLAGVKLITVHVKCSDLAKDVGLDREEIRKSLTAQLENAGIKVVRPEIWSSLPGRCRLQASVDVYKPPHLDALIYNLKVEFVQAVTLARLSETKIDVTTWDRTWFAHGTEKRLAEYVPHNLKVLTAVFIRDHRRANSGSGEKADPEGAGDDPATTSVRPSEATNPGHGTGFIASKSSGVFHKPDCRWAQNISADNLVKYENRGEAIEAGKRPCKFCNP